MALVVQKFGGSSIGNIDKIQHVANKIIEAREQGHRLVVVVSAMEGETNRLISLAKTLNEQPDPREYDLLLATGEQVTTALLAMALLAQGCPARSYNGFHVPIYTDNHHQKARILNVEENIIRNDIEACRVPIIAGFQGISIAGDITTLGRGGSDTTAAALAAALQADECQIYTDVDGIYTADPHIVTQAKRLDTVDFSEMVEFSRAGSQVIQHRAVEIANKYRVPLRILSSFKKGAGTLIQTNGTSGIEQARITGLAVSQQEAKIVIQGLSCQQEALAQFFFLLNDACIEIDMLTQQLISEAHMDVIFTLARSEYLQAELALQALIQPGYAKTVLGNRKVAKLSIIGTGLHSHPGIIHTLFQTLGRESINILLILSSNLRISLVVDESQVVRGMQLLHHAFELDKE